MLQLRQAQKKGNKYAGIDLPSGKITDMLKNNVIEPLKIGKQEIQSASEAANMILRIDDVIASKSTGSPGGKTPGSMPDEEY